MEDSAIIDLYWAREERALSETDTKYGGYCRSIAHNILRNREDTEECVSDTWLHAWNAMPPQRPSILSSFLGRITRNLSFDRCRRQNAEKRGGGALPLALDELSECVPAPGRVEHALEERELSADAAGARVQHVPAAVLVCRLRAVDRRAVRDQGKHGKIDPLPHAGEAAPVSGRGGYHRMKEQTEKIFRAIGDVGDDLIERADRPVRKHAQVWVKWAALAACCALVIGAAAFIVPMFHAGSTAPETASLSVDAAPAETELAAQEMETAEAAPEEAMEEPAAAEAPEASEKSTQALPGADCFAVVPESVTRMSADFQLTCEEDAPLALRSECWLETQTDGEWQPLDAALLKTQEQTDEAAPETAVCTLHYDWQTLYGELDAGEYRLAQPVILPDGSDYTLYAEFTVE